MLGLSLHIAGNADSLDISIPANLILVVVLLLPLPLLFGVRSMTTTPRGRLRALLLILLDLCLLGVAFTPARVMLNARQGTAQINTTFLFVPHRRTVPLASVKGALVRTSELSEALVVIMNDGHGIQLTPFDQVHGSDEAASAINTFVRAHGGSGDPY